MEAKKEPQPLKKGVFVTVFKIIKESKKEAKNDKEKPRPFFGILSKDVVVGEGIYLDDWGTDPKTGIIEKLYFENENWYAVTNHKSKYEIVISQKPA